MNVGVIKEESRRSVVLASGLMILFVSLIMIKLKLRLVMRSQLLAAGTMLLSLLLFIDYGGVAIIGRYLVAIRAFKQVY